MGRYLKNTQLEGGSYAVQLPLGSSSVGPDVPVNGQIRFNQSNTRVELFYNSVWNTIAKVGTVAIVVDEFTGDGVLTAFTLISTGTINGNNASSTFAMGTASGTNTLNYQSATQPMATGVLNTSTNLNTWIYGLNNQDIKGSPTTSPKQVYRNLTLNGTGVKTLQGYVSVQNTYTLTAPATLALNGFTLTNP